MKIPKGVVALLFFVMAGLCQGANLRFFLDEQLVRSLSLKEMIKISKVKDIKLHYHFSRSPVKHYRAIEFSSLLQEVYKDTLKSGVYSEAVLEALDGYKSYSTLETLLTKGGYIAFKDLDIKSGWEPVGFKKVSPAPYFLVWNEKGQTTANEYPWPFALDKIKLVKFADQYPSLYPKGKKKSSAEYQGYKVFKGQCFRCHAINRQGGKVGPDLGAPRNITEYRSKDFLHRFIKNPSSFRYSKMPPHKHLSKEDINHVLVYLASFRNQKKSTPSLKK